MQSETFVSYRPAAGAILAAVLVLVCTSIPAGAIAPKQDSALSDRELRLAEIDAIYQAPAALRADARTQALADLGFLGAPPSAGQLDARGGRWSLLLPVEPLVPGNGMGNELTWESLGVATPTDDAALRASVGQAFRAYLERSAGALRLDLGELSLPSRVTVHDGGRIANVYQPRLVNGVPVRGSYLSATINSGNLVLMSAEKWGDIDVATKPSIGREIAEGVAGSYLQPYAVAGSWDKTELILVPLAKGRANGRSPRFGDGYTHRLAWAVRISAEGDVGRWEALVDAHSGELFAFEDTNRYADVKGGVYPVSNDGVFPDGQEQPGWPMPFQDISTTGGTLTTDTGGNVAATGSMTATFFGPYVNINDQCGAESLTQSDGIDWGTSGGDDCVTPGFGGAGNTHASRTGFYELNKIIEMARGQLPGNGWLSNRLTSNMNINNTCNAFWNGTVNFYRSGGGCSNTGEIAGVFDHEWGHGMDANDATPGIASPSGEGIADIYTALRLNNSCIGRNFLLGSNCSGNGDPCLNCDGVRDIDYLKRASGNPHDYSWSNANCGGSVHCVGGVYSEAVWSLWKRTLQSAPYNYDNNTAHEIVTRLTFIGAGATGTWFSGGPPNGGCGGSSGYMNYLAADDDDGNLNNGTPHMTAIYNAFNDQEIACATPAVQDSGCSGTPATAPVVSTSTGNQLVGLTWGAVSGTTEYEIFRTEGVFACDFGKVKLGATAGTSWNDTGLQNGRDYSYVVIPKGPSDSCFGPASACTTATPVGQPDFSISCSPSSLAIQQGNNDTTTCTVISSFGYTGNVGLSCSGNPGGVSCSFAPASVSPPANGSAASTLTVTVGGGQSTGTFAFDVVGDDGSLTRTTGMSVQVIPAGSNGPQNAVYDGGLGAPKCAIAGSSCDSTTLLDSRNNLSPSEPNQPNTLDVCNDGTSGSYHNDESNDRIVVSTLDGGNFTEGDTVQIDATVWAWSGFSSDTLDLYYAADANSPSWTFIASIVPSGSGVRTLTAQYVLPAGGMQAVRANFRYTGSASPCSGGTYDDHDDLVFTVEPDVQCTVNADCDDGLFCNGAETCNTGTGACEAGTAPTCDDGLYCNGTETCNEGTNSCDAGTAPACDDGLYCNGVESCNEGTDSCDAGTAPTCDDGLFCNGTETCNETSDSCDAGTAPACDDGLYCNGAETCNEGTDSCDAGTAPVCDDGAFCNGTETCNESTDSCDPGAAPCDPGSETCNEGTDTCEPIGCTVNADCDDGLYCNGAETCNTGTGACEAGTAPVCDDGLFCNGTESCNEGSDSCDAGTAPACDDGLFCNGTETCNETSDSCDAGTAPTCDDGLFCNGTETCDEGADSCAAGTPPACDDGLYCNGTETCSEGTDSCVTGSPPVCDDGAFCNGAETCNEGTDSCDAGTAPCTGGQTCNETADVCEGGGGDPVLWISFRSNTAVPGVGTVRDEDIVTYDEGTGTWALQFDGSDVGLSSFEIDGMAILPSGDFLLSFTQPGTIGGLGVDDSDIVRFTPSSLGSNTAGTFSFYFDGSDVGLTGSGEDVDAIALAADGRIMVSTNGAFSGSGASGADEDLFLFTGSLGTSTSGSFVKYFDGGDVGLGGSGQRDVDAAGFMLNGDLALSIVGNSGVGSLTVTDEDVIDFDATTYGGSTSGTFSMRQDLSTLGIASGEDIGSLHVVE